MNDQYKEMDTKELDFADTTFIRDIESRVFQSIVIKCLSDMEGVRFLEGNLIDHLLGREGDARVKGIFVEQDQKNHSVSIKIELNIIYGISIPEKAEEIQTKIAREITRLTGLHVASVHVVFKGLIPKEALEKLLENEPSVEELEEQVSLPTDEDQK